MDDDLRAYSVKEAAEMLGISEIYMRMMIERQDIRSVRAGRRVLVPAQAIRQFLAGMPTVPPPPV